MGRKPRIDRSPEEKWQIVQEGIKSGNASETCRRHRITPNLYHYWSHDWSREAEQGAKAALESTVLESWTAALKAKKVKRPTITDFIDEGRAMEQLIRISGRETELHGKAAREAAFEGRRLALGIIAVGIQNASDLIVKARFEQKTAYCVSSAAAFAQGAAVSASLIAQGQ